MSYIPYGRQYIDQDDINAVVDVLKSDWLTQGPKVKEFEEVVAQYHGCKYAVAFCNGTTALHGAYYVSSKFPFGKKGRVIEDLQSFICWRRPTPADFDKFSQQYWEFITTPITFAATANAGLYCGGAPKFVDIDLATYCIDIGQIESAITDDTRVITPVSYAGYPVDIEAIRNLPKVKENNLCIIHDACHAMGARRNGHGIADFADMTVLSFHPVKMITTGEGGMVLTNNEEYYKKLLLFRSHGITKDKEVFLNEPDGDWYYEMQELGYNYRITDIQCALGISQMKKLDQFIYRRNQIAQMYENELKALDWLQLPPGFDKTWLQEERYKDINSKQDNLHSYHLFPVLVERKAERKRFFDYMRNNGIGVQVHYRQANELEYYAQHMQCNHSVHNAIRVYQGEVSLPMYFMFGESIAYVVAVISQW